MALSKEETRSAMEGYQLHETDSGSASAQIALMTYRINHLTEHCKSNHKDHSARRGLLMLVGQRRRLLRYYRKKHSAEAYKTFIEGLGIRK